MDLLPKSGQQVVALQSRCTTCVNAHGGVLQEAQVKRRTFSATRLAAVPVVAVTLAGAGPRQLS